ncbi:MAG: TIR domain-containing protein, partial [Oculatellaceae cyanobacterium Prado106]|nr:TIR domain-containing protein [Oculatellaceae cyanobacterium Prado106]
FFIVGFPGCLHLTQKILLFFAPEITPQFCIAPPEWLWSRTELGYASAVRLQSMLPGVPNQQLIAQDLSPWDEVDVDAGIKVPVITLEPEPFAAWTQMVAGKGGAWTPGFVFESEATGDGAMRRRSLTTSNLDAQQRVQRFRVTASPMARRLAGLLAAAPVISLPVVRILQDRLLPKSKQVHVAEVFLGGLLKPLVEIQTHMNPDAIQYEFLDGVRDRLIESVATSDAVSVLDEVSKFVAERLGMSVDAFAAMLQNPSQAEDRELAGRSRPFAMVTAQILKQLGGEYARFAEGLERSYQDNVDLIETTEVANRILLWEQENTKIYALHTDRPWSASPFNALVIPVGISGSFGRFGHAFENFLNEYEPGNDLLTRLILSAMEQVNQISITPQQPMLVPLDNALPALVPFKALPVEYNRYLPLSDNPKIQRFIICATVNSRGGRSVRDAAIAMESILRLAEERRLERVILPLLGTGDNGLPVDIVATTMLNVIRSLKPSGINEITFVDRNISTIETICSISQHSFEEALLEDRVSGEGDILQILSRISNSSAKQPIEVFFSYSREDTPLRDKLEVHLHSLKRQGVITSWHDRQILAGSEWKEEIDHHIQTADIILLLISPNFVNSQYCYEIELPDAMARHEAREAYVVPILLRPVALWKNLSFAKLQVYPSGGKPVTRWSNEDDAFADIAEGVAAAVESLLKQRQQARAEFDRWLIQLPVPISLEAQPELEAWQIRTKSSDSEISEKVSAILTFRQKQARFAEQQQREQAGQEQQAREELHWTEQVQQDQEQNQSEKGVNLYIEQIINRR